MRTEFDSAGVRHALADARKERLLSGGQQGTVQAASPNLRRAAINSSPFRKELYD